MDKDLIVHDLVMLELSKNTDNLTPHEITAKYFELLPVYEKAFKEDSTTPKVKVRKKSDFGL